MLAKNTWYFKKSKKLRKNFSSIIKKRIDHGIKKSKIQTNQQEK